MSKNVDGDLRQTISMTVNGEPVDASTETRKLLAHFLREDLNLAGVRIGCDTTSCGACAVLLDGRAVKSCTMFAVQAGGKSVTTIEGIGTKDTLHPVQAAFHEQHALQCGFCTSGFVMATLELLRNTPDPSEHEIREGISGNLCRCTGYANIVSAVRATAEALRQSGTGRD
ncbi:MAG: (2Fe-2S)-binding protein [bacterium]|nr:(2Fe-2S)-binding protein [bacterium]MDE0287731.1 (2Fe-2S)-binding protein [bacterium]MDE0438137.1 (2Fe-2S)-binding protein [bacterium]